MRNCWNFLKPGFYEGIIFRIVPDETKCPSGYLCSFLSSPLGQAQLTANIYGAVVDEVTEGQTANMLVPMPETAKDRDLVSAVDAAMRESVAKRSKAASLVNASVDGVSAPSARDVPRSRRFTLRTKRIGGEMRLDAGTYNPVLIHALDWLGNVDAIPLREVAEVFMPPRFKRVYVEPEYGVPFIQGSHVVHFQAAGLKHLSREHERIDEVTVRAGWILVTRSGTVGRVTMCPEEWDGWAASEHIFRIVPNDDKCPGGYLCAFLSSSLGQVQLAAQIHGAVVDELTEDHVRNVLVPLPESQTARRIDSIMRSGIAMKSQAVAAAERSIVKLMERFDTQRHGSTRRQR